MVIAITFTVFLWLVILVEALRRGKFARRKAPKRKRLRYKGLPAYRPIGITLQDGRQFRLHRDGSVYQGSPEWRKVRDEETVRAVHVRVQSIKAGLK